MIIPDINLLVYAHNARAAEFTSARRWWEECLNGSEPIGLSWISISGFIRLMTHARALKSPMEVREAVARVQEWLAQPIVQSSIPDVPSTIYSSDLCSSSAQPVI